MPRSALAGLGFGLLAALSLGGCQCEERLASRRGSSPVLAARPVAREPVARPLPEATTDAPPRAAVPTPVAKAAPQPVENAPSPRENRAWPQAAPQPQEEEVDSPRVVPTVAPRMFERPAGFAGRGELPRLPGRELPRLRTSEEMGLMEMPRFGLDD